MFDQAQLTERTLARVSSQAFVAAACLEDRVDLVQAASGSRLYSHQLAEVWAGILGEAASRLSSPQVELILREMLLLSPNHDRAEALYTALMQPRDALQRPEQAVFMIVSCVKYLAKAQALRAALSARGALSWIITGNATMAEAEPALIEIATMTDVIQSQGETLRIQLDGQGRNRCIGEILVEMGHIVMGCAG